MFLIDVFWRIYLKYSNVYYVKVFYLIGEKCLENLDEVLL